MPSDTQNDKVYGFIGLGQMGGPMAANIAKSGLPLWVYDKAGTTERAPEGAQVADSLAAVIANADTVFMSVPDGPVSIAIAKEVAQLNDRRTSVIVDLSTIGPDAAHEADGILKDAGITYMDGPVSGGRKGAIAGTITVMCAGPKDAFDEHEAAFRTFCKNPFHVGETPGQGQVIKMLNNFLSGTAMAATTEAVLFGLSQGLEMKTILDVVNVSTGMNTATLDKFPNRVLPGTFDGGFATKLLAKDVRLFTENAEKAGTPNAIGTLISRIWDDCEDTLPGSDFCRVYEFIRDGGEKN